MTTHEAVIVGAGPAGLAAAFALRSAGVTDVVLLERAAEPGGIPRYCGHTGFGIGDFRRLLRGPDYAREMTARLSGVAIRTNTTVLGIEPDGVLRLSTPDGLGKIAARAILLATGTRETPRAARLVSGARPWGVTTTGAFQEIVCTGGRPPFVQPVIVGAEWVGFSNLLTARHAGVRPVAMIEAGARARVRGPAGVIARGLFGVPLLTECRLVAIVGQRAVEAVEVERRGVRSRIKCDGVIFSGEFVPEATLVRASGLAFDDATGGPRIDTAWRCSDPRIFAAGNLLRPVESAGWASREGRLAASAMLELLGGRSPRDLVLPVRPDGALRYIYPQRILLDAGDPSGRASRHVVLYGRAAEVSRGRLRLLADGVEVARRRVSQRIEARLSIGVQLARLAGCAELVAVLD